MWKEEGRKEEVKGGSQGRFLVVSVRDGERERDSRKTGQRREFKNFAVDANGDAGLD